MELAVYVIFFRVIYISRAIIAGTGDGDEEEDVITLLLILFFMAQ